MAGKCDEIGAKRLHVERSMADGLGGIDDRDGTHRASAATELRDRVDRAERVGNVGEGEELHLRREQLVERSQVESAFRIGTKDRDVFEGRAAGAGGLLPRNKVGMVLDLGRQNDIPGLEVRLTPSVGYDVDALGRAAGENDLGGVGGVDELRDAGAGAFVGVGGAHRKRMEAAMHVAVVALVVVDERFDHRSRLLRGGAVVEVDERLAVDLLMQNREIGADFLDVEHGHQSLCVSVVVGSGSDFSASMVACQPSVAHLMRAGNAWTPANAARSLISSGARPVVTIS